MCKCEGSHQTKSYNGWTNYETWLCNLHLENCEIQSQALGEMRDDCFRDASGDSLQEWREDALDKFRDGLRRHVTGSDSEDAVLPSGLWADLLESAFQEICWDELAESFASEYRSDADLFWLADDLGCVDDIEEASAYQTYRNACDEAVERLGEVEIFPIDSWKAHGCQQSPYRFEGGVMVACE